MNTTLVLALVTWAWYRLHSLFLGDIPGHLWEGAQVGEGDQWLWTVFWHHLQNGWSMDKEMDSEFLGLYSLLCPPCYLKLFKGKALWRHRVETMSAQGCKHIDSTLKMLPGEAKGQHGMLPVVWIAFTVYWRFFMYRIMAASLPVSPSHPCFPVFTPLYSPLHAE